ncbi:hypothetical protein R3W88_012045 [Solanum pinnatisectum]|uniref:Reverse transcriptase zinc-binding domain-containing protein n=1 Tax=Solanum pinnatisectum TaxID=50273 RepID=A0AAV9LBR3_9SOLN|nr:hypothetical protein R3W88_012045 [Solanum pinnatisectum]
MNKSSIYFGGVPEQEKLNILQQSGFGCREFPFKYLGVPLSTKKVTIMQWSPLVNKIIARISSWTAKKLSYAGRMQLVQSVLFGIQAYWSQLFTIPAKAIKIIESYCRSFTWSGSNTITKRALIAWEKVCLPKSVGGMNLINIRLWNQAAIAKTCWDLAHKSDKLWIRWIHSFYIKNQQFFTAPNPKQASWMVGFMGDDINQQCKLCQHDLETRDHLFVYCEFTRDRIIEKARGNSLTAQMFRLMYAEWIHAVWRERNHRIFEDKSRNFEHIVKEIAYMCCMRVSKGMSSRLQHLSFI